MLTRIISTGLIMLGFLVFSALVVTPLLDRVDLDDNDDNKREQ